MGFEWGFSWIDALFPVLFGLVFVLVAAGFVWVLFSSIRREMHNNRSPRLSVWARVIAKRQDVRHGRGFADYYVTFAVESGDRMELEMPGEEYGLLAEGDEGMLRFQGTRFLGFERRGAAL